MFFFSIILYFWSFFANSYSLQLFDISLVSINNLRFKSFYKFYNFFKKHNNYFNFFFKNLFFMFNLKNFFLAFFFFFFFIFNKYFFFFVRKYWIADFLFYIIFFFNKFDYSKINFLAVKFKKFKKLESNNNFINNINKNYLSVINTFFQKFFNFNLKSSNQINVFSKLSNFFIKFNNSFIMKFIKNKYFNSFTILFLRKNRVFNKGRYSRNRQNFRTGVYWCLYVNILAVLGIYYFFYRFTINFGYIWWFFIICLNCIFFNKFLKLNLFSIYKLLFFLKKILSWYLFFFKKFF